jgi:hypothetical protein
MTVQELRALKVDLLDTIHEIAGEPIPDIEEARRHVEEIFSVLETELGKETRTPAR